MTIAVSYSLPILNSFPFREKIQRHRQLPCGVSAPISPSPERHRSVSSSKPPPLLLSARSTDFPLSLSRLLPPYFSHPRPMMPADQFSAVIGQHKSQSLLLSAGAIRHIVADQPELLPDQLLLLRSSRHEAAAFSFTARWRVAASHSSSCCSSSHGRLAPAPSLLSLSLSTKPQPLSVRGLPSLPHPLLSRFLSLNF